MNPEFSFPYFRVLLFIGLFLSVFLFSSFVASVLILIPIVYYDYYWEGLLLFLLIDLAYAGTGSIFETISFLLIGCIVFAIVQTVKGRLFFLHKR